ncbi:undecaprenyl-diphosphatase [Legionella sp. D16C41]|uniref:undecaprenyl-diphosphatase n=1 Tax=Legionella sp. D16C41 TaxID=3402688 RepID=UPI003AF4E057
MNQLNLALFSEINAGADLSGYPLWLAIFTAKYLVIFVVLFLFALWLWGSKRDRSVLMQAFSANCLALFINWIIGLFWFHPRPFMIGIGHTYLIHAPDSSFPSNHVAALCAISLVFLWREPKKLITSLLLLATVLVAWARIYVGIHFPFDMIGGVVVALVSVGFVIYLTPLIERYFTPIMEYIHRILFTKIFHHKGTNN